MNRMMKNLGLYLILIVLVVSLVNMFITPMQQTRDVAPLSYSEFLEQVDKGNVTEVAIDGSSITGKLKDGRVFNTYAVGVGDLAKEIAARGVNVEVKPPQAAPWWSGMVSSLFPTLLLIGAWIFILYHMQGGGSKVMSFAKSKAKMFLDNRPKVTFDDVAGCDEAKEELHEVIEFLRNPRKFSALGARVPRGVLLLGHPGTGKTLLARAVAGEADVPFFSISGSDFVEMFVGVGAARVRDLFEQARKYQPCIIFIDEIDAVGRHRGAGLGGGHDEREQTLNQLLVELDGFDASTGIIVIAATNRPDILDPALLRPGRFDRQIVVDRPDFNGRLAILKVHLRDKKVDPNVNLEIIAKRTPGFVGADLANLVNESALLAARRNKKQITMEEFEEAIDRVIAGPERRSRVISPKEKRVIALHESGHALVAKLLPDCDPVHKVSIIPRGHQALGYTMQLPEEDRFLISKKELLNQICVLLGGRVTEELKSDDITTGSQNDLERATQIARKMVTEFGMSERLGPVRLGRKQHEIFLGRDIVEDRNYSEEIAYAIDQEVRRIIDDCYELVRDLLVKHDSVLEKIAAVLLEKEVLEGEELDSLINEKLDEVTDRSEGDADAESVAAAQAVEKKTSLQLEPRIDPA
ncbi:MULTISPECIES: ATP-dependent zinc metalloprotease FtsH [Acetomicrobium]|uniref:ATP-dependent zinc metalloprotease FtsH n=1 Tax=Acetomicrobium hydrogeniformans TaxID=649746 RepID=A0A7V6ZF74_9BACT|nr:MULTISPECIES: ATP-dependent zinc metalloprotease FtsH [Acetomicrobium]HHZ04822.1 ATP-dependent metallopeptidase FtsH/Yme1/Tma family protein [Acetomicrobium hydrogeniformans]